MIKSMLLKRFILQTQRDWTTKYVTHITQILSLLGQDTGQILNFEVVTEKSYDFVDDPYHS